MSTVWQDIANTYATPGVTRIYMQGPPGVGKTHYALTVMGGPDKAIQTTLNEDVSVQELLGHYLPQGDKFGWHDGPLTMGFREGTPTVVNEISRASQAVQDLMLGILDDPGIAAITLPSGETIRPGKDFRVIATSNSPFSEMPEPLQDRFDANFVINEPNPDLVKYLNALLAGVGEFVRKSYGDIGRAISPRRTIAFCKLKQTMDLDQAARIAYGQRAKDIMAALRAAEVVSGS